MPRAVSIKPRRKIARRVKVSAVGRSITTFLTRPRLTRCKRRLSTRQANRKLRLDTRLSRPDDLLAHRPGAEFTESVGERLALDLDTAPLVRDRIERLAGLEDAPTSAADGLAQAATRLWWQVIFAV
jgi:hypothetical protein